MLKRLVMIACFTALIVTVILVARYDKLHDTEGKGYDIKCAQPSEPSATMNSLICTAEHGQKAETSEYSPAWWHVFFAWPEGITALLILLTLVAISLQTFYTRRAAEATEGAVTAAKQDHKLSEDTAKRQLRAYICLDSAEVIFVGHQPIAKVNFKNCGQTPAYEVHGWIAVDIAPHPLDRPFAAPPSNLFKPKTTVGPDGKFGYPGQRKNPLFTTAEIASVQADSAFFAYGRVDYKDTFGKDWYTNVRLIAGGKAGLRAAVSKEDGSTRWILGPDLAGNDAT